MKRQNMKASRTNRVETSTFNEIENGLQETSLFVFWVIFYFFGFENWKRRISSFRTLLHVFFIYSKSHLNKVNKTQKISRPIRLLLFLNNTVPTYLVVVQFLPICFLNQLLISPQYLNQIFIRNMCFMMLHQGIMGQR